MASSDYSKDRSLETPLTAGAVSLHSFRGFNPRSPNLLLKLYQAADYSACACMPDFVPSSGISSPLAK